MSISSDLVARTRRLAELTSAVEHMPHTYKRAEDIDVGDTFAWADLAARVVKRYETATGNVGFGCSTADSWIVLEFHPAELVPVVVR